jgi:hypothetical protein
VKSGTADLGAFRRNFETVAIAKRIIPSTST